MSTSSQRINHNLRLFGIGILVVIFIMMIWSNNQTASFTDVLDTIDTQSHADLLMNKTEYGTHFSTLKHYDAISGATLRITFFVPDLLQDEFERSIQSSYGFFVTNHNNTSIITLYLPENIVKNKEVLFIGKLSQDFVLDSMILFDEDNIDEIVIQQKNSQQSHY